MLVTELICLESIRTSSEKYKIDGTNKKETMNAHQKRVIGRLMRRILNQIPVYEIGSKMLSGCPKKPVKNFEHQKTNLKYLIHRKHNNHNNFTMAFGGTKIENDLKFVDNICR